MGTRWRIIGVLALVLCGARPGALHAETLYDAFDAAYGYNPTLSAQRAAVRVAVQDQAIAATGYAPAITASADYGYRDQNGKAPLNPASELVSHPRGYGVTLSQNIWNGFRTTNSVAREDAGLAAQRNQLRDVEQNVLVDVATAYADVVRDRAIIALRVSDQALLGVRARETRLRFSIGDLTRTDVDQSVSNLARSDADLDADRMEVASAEYDFHLYCTGAMTLEALVDRVAGKLVATHLGSRHPVLPSMDAALRQLREGRAAA